MHKKFVLLGVAFVLAGLFVAAYMVSAYMETFFVPGTHAYLGTGVFAFLIITPVLGIIQFRLKDGRVHALHRWSGRITILLGLLNIFAGVQMVRAMLFQG
ncbi:Uncharacterised protein [uncultured archaeon]|nr:Uncharacterised protein [uncultured archaeon]